MRNGILILVVIISFFQISAHGAVLTVGHTAGFDFQTITAAIAAASEGDEIRVADGTYSTIGTYPETFPIIMKEGVNLIRLTSDIVPVINANQTGQVIHCIDILETRIEGFRIIGGDTYEPEIPGGGLCLQNAFMIIDSCDISENVVEGQDGGGIGVVDSSLELINCTIIENVVKNSAFYHGHGGGIYAKFSTVTMDNCQVQLNTSANNAGGIFSVDSFLQITSSSINANSCQFYGGGIFSADSDLQLYRCRVTENTANEGGGIYFGSSGDITLFEQCRFTGNISEYHDGGGVHFSVTMNPPPVFSHCIFTDNSSTRYGGSIFAQHTELIFLFTSICDGIADSAGGGIYCYNCSLEMAGCELAGNDGGSGGGGIYALNSDLSIFSALFLSNTVHEFGGGISLNGSTATVTNCTFNLNHASDGGGAISVNSHNLVLLNSILWNNDIDELFAFSPSTLDVQYCDIQGGYLGTGNIDADPLFVEGCMKSHFLSQTAAGQSVNSPCLNAGSNTCTNVNMMLNGQVYSLDDASTRTDRVYDTGQVDMGVHFFQNPAECDELGCTILMPSTDFGPGDLCYCDLLIQNNTLENIPDTPVFVILEVAGYLFFAPEFDNFSYYPTDVLPGVRFIHVIPRFTWPSGAGSASDVHWYAAMTNEELTDIMGEWDMFTFGWHL